MRLWLSYRYFGKDTATAFPLLEKPAGGPLSEFYLHHHNSIYPANKDNDSNSATALGTMTSHDPVHGAPLAPVYLHLIYRWALQILSALSVIHSHGIIHMKIIDQDSFWLREDLSIALVGFLSADFVNLNGERVRGNTHNGNEFRLMRSERQKDQQPTAKVDLFDWATLVYTFRTARHPLDGRGTEPEDVDEMIRTESFPLLEGEGKLGAFVRKCWMGEYESAADMLRDVVAYLRERGVEVQGDDVRGFDCHHLAQF